MSERLSPQREAAEAAVTSLVNGGYSQQIAREILAGVRAEVRAEAAAELAAVRAELATVRAEVERTVRAEIAADFKAYGKTHATLTWGQAYFVATDGPNGGAS